MICNHAQIRVERTPEGPHYAKEVCVDCNGFVRWLPKPETVERLAENKKKFAEIDSWFAKTEKFVKSLSEQDKLSPRQQECLDKIYAQTRGY